MLTMPTYKPEDDNMSLNDVALKIHGDITSHAGLSVSEDDAVASIPDSLYMLLRLLFGVWKLINLKMS